MENRTEEVDCNCLVRGENIVEKALQSIDLSTLFRQESETTEKLCIVWVDMLLLY